MHAANLCLSVIVGVTPGASCPADVNKDGVLDQSDIHAFVQAFLAQDPAADIIPDNVIEVGDITAFVSSFINSSGCAESEVRPRGAGWHAASRSFGIRGTALRAPTIFQAPDDFTVIIPFYFDPEATHPNWEHHLLTAGDSIGRNRHFRWYLMSDASTAGVAVNFQSSRQNRIVAGSDAPLQPDTHYMAVWTYERASGTHRVLLYEEGSPDAVSSGTRTGLPMDPWNRFDELCIGNLYSDGTSNIHIGLDSPVLGAVCRKGVLSDEELSNIWNGGVYPNFRSLFPQTPAGLAWALAMVNEHYQYHNYRLDTYNPWDAATKQSRIHVWDQSFSYTGATWVNMRSGLHDVVPNNSGLTAESPDVRNADFFDELAEEGGFWRPGQPVHPNEQTAIVGKLPAVTELINGTRSRSTPLLMGSLGNSRTANVGTGPGRDGDVLASLQSLAYGFVRARPSVYSGFILTNVAHNPKATIALLDRHTAGDPPGALDDNKNRMGFGSSRVGGLVDGPCWVYQLRDGDLMEFRLDTLDPETGVTRETQTLAVLARRPGAGSVVALATKQDARTSLAGDAVGLPTAPINLDTTFDTAELGEPVTDSDTVIAVRGDRAGWVGQLVNFSHDDDLAYVQSFLGYDNGNTLLELKHPLIGDKPSLTMVRAGPLAYHVIGAGDLQPIPGDDPARMRGVSITSTGNTEIIAGGFYFADKPNGICIAVMGHGGHGEGEQVDNEFTGAFARFSSDLGIEALHLSYASQRITDLDRHLQDRLGPLTDSIEIIGAPEGTYAGSHFLEDNPFLQADSGVRAFAASRTNIALYPIYNYGYDFVSAAYAGFMSDGAHQSPLGSLYRNRLLWDRILAVPPD